MKFSTTVAIASLAVAASAQTLQISNPTLGTVWKAGSTYFVAWTASCANMGAAGASVNVELVAGPSGSVQWVADIGKLDCSGGNTRANVTVPADVPAGDYSVRVRTTPVDSYSPAFKVQGNAPPPPTNTGSSTTTVPKPTTSPSSGSALVANVLAAAGLAATAAMQLF